MDSNQRMIVSETIALPLGYREILEVFMNCIYFKIRTKKGSKYFYCSFKGKIIDFSSCRCCSSRMYKKVATKPLKWRNKAHSTTKATSIPISVKNRVWERDKHRCIFCKKEVDVFFSNSHYIKRSHLGLGVEENIFTACPDCHHRFDDTLDRDSMLPKAREYLMSFYPDWSEESLVYKKYRP